MHLQPGKYLAHFDFEVQVLKKGECERKKWDMWTSLLIEGRTGKKEQEHNDQNTRT